LGQQFFPFCVFGIKDEEVKEGNGHKDKEVIGVSGQEEENEAVNAHGFTQKESEHRGRREPVRRFHRYFLEKLDNEIMAQRYEQENVFCIGSSIDTQGRTELDRNESVADSQHKTSINEHRTDHGQADVIGGPELLD
jgi:hypothetical protein